MVTNDFSPKKQATPELFTYLQYNTLEQFIQTMSIFF